MNRLIIQRLSEIVCVSIESQRGAMEVHLTPDEARKAAHQLMEAAIGHKEHPIAPRKRGAL